jgi:hypothetical protein
MTQLLSLLPIPASLVAPVLPPLVSLRHILASPILTKEDAQARVLKILQ